MCGQSRKTGTRACRPDACSSELCEKDNSRLLSLQDAGRCPYGVDLEFWKAGLDCRGRGPLRFIYAGQMSLRKGIPLLLEAWEKADMRDAELELVGLWQLAETRLKSLPRGVTHWGPCSPEALRARFCAADVFVFPSFFEGFGLVLLEAMACGLPAIASEATAGPDIYDGGLRTFGPSRKFGSSRRMPVLV